MSGILTPRSGSRYLSLPFRKPIGSNCTLGPHAISLRHQQNAISCQQIEIILLYIKIQRLMVTKLIKLVLQLVTILTDWRVIVCWSQKPTAEWHVTLLLRRVMPLQMYERFVVSWKYQLGSTINFTYLHFLY